MKSADHQDMRHAERLQGIWFDRLLYGSLFLQTSEKWLTSAAFLEAVLVTTRRHVMIIQDGVRYHTSAAMQEFFARHKTRLTVV
jgi:hypothetical protein